MGEVKYGEILGPETILGSEDEATRADRVRSRFFATLRKAARYIPFADDLVAAYFCALDPGTPHRVRATLLAALAYFILPADIIPDFLIGVGFGDDAAVLFAAINMVRNHITPAHREAAQRVIDGGAPSSARARF